MLPADPYLHLLTLCLPIDDTPLLTCRVAEAAARIPDWNMLPTLAERHNMAPLLYRRLKSAAVEPPPAIQRSLAAQTLRHRLINQVRRRLLGRIAIHFRQAEIPLLVLKGAALAHLLYPEPGLRPMNDLDILVRRQDLEISRQIFREMGFQGNSKEINWSKDRHLPALNQALEGFNISLEVHYCLFQDAHLRPWFGFEDLVEAPLSFTLAENIHAQTLGYSDMLYHLCQHALYNDRGLAPLRWIWIADILNFSERFCAQIDWDLLHKRRPAVIHALQLLHFISPLSETLRQQASIDLPAAPAQAGEDLKGWPVLPLPQWRRRGIPGVFKDTLFPGQWWLRLHYGLQGPPLLWYHWGNLLREALWRRTQPNR